MKKIKTILFLLILVTITITTFSQNVKDCQKIVKFTIQSLNNGSSLKIEKYLSDNFAILNYEGIIARSILKQLFSRFKNEVKSHKELKQIKTENQLKFIYNIKYKELGEKEAIFIFNEKNQLKKIKLFEIKVNTMSGDPTNIEKSNKDIIEIPFFRFNNLICIKTIINNESRNCILDTGSPKLILNSKYYSKKDSSQKKDSSSIKKIISSTKGVNGQISDLKIDTIDQFDFYGIKINNQAVLSIDLSHLEGESEHDIHGLIGFEIIKDYDIIFDYQNNKIILINPNKFESYKKEFLSQNTLNRVPFKLQGHIPVIKIQIGNKPYLFGIDSGAESNLINKKLFKKLKGKMMSKIEKVELAGAGKDFKEVKLSKIKNTIIGNKSFKNLSTVFSDISHLNSAYDLKIDGLIGYEVISKQKTLISFDREEVIFIE